MLSTAPTGLSGFDIELTLEEGAIAEFVAVDFPDFGLTSAFPLPGDSVRLRAVDLNDVVPNDSVISLLVSVHVRGTSPGSTAIIPIVHVMDDESGDPIDAAVVQASLTVSAN